MELDLSFLSCRDMYYLGGGLRSYMDQSALWDIEMDQRWSDMIRTARHQSEFSFEAWDELLEQLEVVPDELFQALAVVVLIVDQALDQGDSNYLDDLLVSWKLACRMAQREDLIQPAVDFFQEFVELHQD